MVKVGGSGATVGGAARHNGLLQVSSSRTHAVTDDHLAQLSLLLGKNWAKALQVLDQQSIQCFTGEMSGRQVFQVEGI